MVKENWIYYEQLSFFMLWNVVYSLYIIFLSIKKFIVTDEEHSQNSYFSGISINLFINSIIVHLKNFPSRSIPLLLFVQACQIYQFLTFSSISSLSHINGHRVGLATESEVWKSHKSQIGGKALGSYISGLTVYDVWHPKHTHLQSIPQILSKYFAQLFKFPFLLEAVRKARKFQSNLSSPEVRHKKISWMYLRTILFYKSFLFLSIWFKHLILIKYQISK